MKIMSRCLPTARSQHLPGLLLKVAAFALLAANCALASAGVSTTIHAEDVRAKIEVSDAHSTGGRQLGVTVDFGVAPGWHIYGEPLPPEYTTTKIKFDSNLVQSQSLKFPPPTPLRFEALDQTFPVYNGNFQVTGDLVLKPKIAPGMYKLTGTIDFQECNDSMCKMPQSARFELPLTISPSASGGPKA
jgi:DsbC/DsbD-like thiol-disulfide interchange protein